MLQNSGGVISPDQTSNSDSLPGEDFTTKSETWIAIHNNKIINFYPSQLDAVNGLNGYKMSTQINLNDMTDVYQII